MSRAAWLLAGLVLAAGTGGCLADAKRWVDGQGLLRVGLKPLGPEATDVEAFSNLTVTVWGVGLYSSDGGGREFYFDPPLRVEFVANATAGRVVPLVETEADLRAVIEVEVRVTVNESKLVRNRPIDGCFAGRAHEKPCVRVPEDGVYTIDEPAFSAPRGGVADFVVPMGVHWAASSGEYYLRAEVGLLDRS